MSGAPKAARRFRGTQLIEVDGVTAAVAEDRVRRLLGLALLDVRRARPLLLGRCRAVHTFGMRFAIEVVFIDAAGRVLRRAEDVGPGRFLREPGARAVLEIPKNRAPGGAG